MREDGACVGERRRRRRVRKDGESPRRSRSVMVVETAGSHLAKGQTGSEEEAAGRHGGAHAHNSTLQMTSAGSPTASPTSRLTPSAANTSRDGVVAAFTAANERDNRQGREITLCSSASCRKRALAVALHHFGTRNYQRGSSCDHKTEVKGHKPEEPRASWRRQEQTNSLKPPNSLLHLSHEESDDNGEDAFSPP